MTRDDRGATAIFLAFVLLLLIGVAAVAVDLGRGWVERRQDQTAVDIAAVAGALSYGTSTNAPADQVMSAARTNLDITYSDDDWEDLWDDCDGSSRPAGFLAAQSSIGVIDCIGLGASHLWVRLPEQTIETTFAKAIGFDTISTRAEATVTLLDEVGSGALPFAIRGNSGSGEVCLDTGPNPEEPCESNESGSFGNIGPPLFGNDSLGTTPSCTANINRYVPESIAMGIDHLLWTFDQATWDDTGWDPDDSSGGHDNEIVNHVDTHKDECTDTGGEVAEPADGIPINTVLIDTGNNTKEDVEEGMMTGTDFPDGEDARLTRTDGETRSVEGVDLDNVALWEYLTDSNGVAECEGSTIRGLPTIDEKNDAMRACLETYETNGEDDVIFSDSIVESPRLGFAPRLHHNNLGSGGSPRPIKRFENIFIHGLFLKGNSSDEWFYPDDDTLPLDVGNFQTIDLVTAYLLMDSMVSPAVHDALGGFSNDTWQPFIWE